MRDEMDRRDFMKRAAMTTTAVSLAMSDGRPHHIDVLVHSAAGARWYRGSSDGEEEYEEDPEASVFERIEVRADSQGRVA